MLCARAFALQFNSIRFPNNLLTTVTKCWNKIPYYKSKQRKFSHCSNSTTRFPTGRDFENSLHLLSLSLSHTHTLSLTRSLKPASLSKHFESLDATKLEHKEPHCISPPFAEHYRLDMCFGRPTQSHYRREGGMPRTTHRA